MSPNPIAAQLAHHHGRLQSTREQHATLVASPLPAATGQLAATVALLLEAVNALVEAELQRQGP